MNTYNEHVCEYYLHMWAQAFWFGGDWAKNGFDSKRKREESMHVINEENDDE